MTGTLEQLIIATAVFLGLHIVPSSFLRQAIIQKISLKGYLAGYSLLSIASLVWMVLAFNDAPYGTVYWTVGNWGRYIAIGAMVLAAILFVGPYTGTNPTSIGAQGKVRDEAARSGLNAITRHPLMWALIIWAVSHLINNGDLKSIIFFGGMGGLALAGTLLIDAKRAREIGPDWEDYTAHTSNIPFLAIVQGRAKLSLLPIWWKLLIGVFVFFTFFHMHTLIIGVSPFPL